MKIERPWVFTARRVFGSAKVQGLVTTRLSVDALLHSSISFDMWKGTGIYLTHSILFRPSPRKQVTVPVNDTAESVASGSRFGLDEADVGIA